MTIFSMLISLLLTAQTNTAPQVMVTIKPIHALVSGVMAEMGQPDLLLSGGESPHTYSMKPSQVKQLHQADLLIWVGSGVETFLQKPLTTLEQTKQLRLDQVNGLHLLKVRTGGTHHTPHHVTADAMQSIEMDPHIWLDPDNAKVIVKAVTDTLSRIDPANATAYKQNATQLNARITQLDEQLTQQLTPLKNLPFLVFHDAYQYFEQHYHLTAMGSVTFSPEQAPGAKHLHELRSQIKTQDIRCVFSEPQFTSKLIPLLLEDTAARHGTLDPIGSTLEAGTEAYFILLQNLANALETCLLPKS